MLNLRPKAARDDEPDLTPLIDMVFILLIFFILAASVSYTHLDVYKRQGSCRRGRKRWEAG